MRPMIARIAAAIAAAIVAFIVGTIGLDVSPEAAQHIQAGVEALMLGIGLTVYAVGHKFLNRFINPADDATGEGT